MSPQKEALHLDYDPSWIDEPNEGVEEFADSAHFPAIWETPTLVLWKIVIIMCPIAMNKLLHFILKLIAFASSFPKSTLALM
jgi:hypothetical protein